MHDRIDMRIEGEISDLSYAFGYKNHLQKVWVTQNTRPSFALAS